ncbi:FumA C-terminus/TtdB family hydratase beta subunit [Parasutterella excrementihominis]|mgnify:FL=1|uniref:FumA C-terminus/TtdB family hydratase beta subunit n=1 Tax=Parasutterella excrementihominis TaxID=487175 RepID=UPI0012BCF38A|nr:FumA C-terminus/TtdB family hydratase beta subunit [Parasutterella excrementihominis]MTT65424.1 fumarate hydratase [Parasutterella excrementihominis]MTT93651.1 fumarate hydratase [Parasutterella excrementihominis]
MAEYTINLPATDEDVEKLNIGDTVYINGTVCTARDMAHLQMRELIENGKELPEKIAGGAIFHAGPVMKKDENDQWKLRVIGPTTSIRMEPHADFMGRMGVKLIIGKGGMGEDSLAAFKKYKQAYLQAAPGCAVVLAAGIKDVKNVHWYENGMPEAMWVLEADKFGPFVVTMDCKGNSRYNDVKVKAREIAEDILSKK